MNLYQFQKLVSDRIDRWNNRNPSARFVRLEFTRRGVNLWSLSSISCKDDNFIRGFNYDPAFEHLSAFNLDDCGVVLDALIDILEKYFGQKEDVKMPTKNETNMNNLVIYTGSDYTDIRKAVDGTHVSSYFVDDILTTYETYNRYLGDYFGSKEWKRWKHRIDRVIFNDPATIILWKSGEKTVVKCGPDEQFDKEKGLAMALCKYVLGNKGNFNQFFKALMKEDK